MQETFLTSKEFFGGKGFENWTIETAQATPMKKITLGIPETASN